MISARWLGAWALRSRRHCCNEFEGDTTGERKARDDRGLFKVLGEDTLEERTCTNDHRQSRSSAV